MKKYLFVLLSFATTYTMYGYAAFVGPDVKQEIIQDWTGGLATTVQAHKIDKKYSPDMRNVFVHRTPGSVERSKGFITVGSTNALSDGRFMFTFSKQDGSTYFLVSDGSSVLSTQDFNSYVLVSSGLNNTVNLDAAQVQETVWFTNGSDNVFVWDGTNRRILTYVPKFRYIEYFQGRVFGLNTSAESSSLDFSDIASTAGIALSPENPIAWPVINRLYVGRGDGDIGTALFTYKGQLQIGKTRSIYTLFGSSVYDFFVRRTESNIGPESNDSVVNQDGMVYFKGKDGIYEWNGGLPRRISDGIIPDVNSMLSFNTNIISNVWDSYSSFLKGTFYGSSVTADGSVTMNDTRVRTNQERVGGTPDTPFLVDNPTTEFGSIVSTTTFNGFGLYRIGRFLGSVVDIMRCNGGIQTGTSNIYFKNGRTGQTATYTNHDPVPTGFNSVRYDIGATPFLVTGFDLNSGTVQVRLDGSCPGGENFHYYPATDTYAGHVDWVPFSTYSYVSEIATANATITSWDSFNAEQSLGGGFVNYYVKTATSVVTIATQPWKSVQPGVRLSESPTNLYIQWTSTISSLISDPNDLSLNIPSTATVDFVSISYISGLGNRNRAFATSWKNEYWLSASTESTGNFNKEYVKSYITNSNPDAWNTLDGMPIKSFTKDGSNILYAGSSSSGTFYRLDYGTNYNGNPINSYYNTPDMDFGQQFNNKTLQFIGIDADKVNSTKITVSVSTNSGVSYTASTVAYSGSGELFKIIYGLTWATGNQFRFKIENNQLDESFRFHNLGIWYLPKNVWSDTTSP